MLGICNVASIQDHPCVAGINRQIALADMRQFAGDKDCYWSIWWEDGGIERDRVAALRVLHCLTQRAGTAIGRACDQQSPALGQWG